MVSWGEEGNYLNVDAASEEERRARKLMNDLVQEVIKACDPASMIQRTLRVNGNKLIADGKIFRLDRFKKIVVIGAGKGSARMAEMVERLLGAKVAGGVVVVPYETKIPSCDRIEIIQAGHPVPDRSGLQATKRMMQQLRDARRDQLVICLISGGGSALMPSPAEGITLEDEAKTEGLLMRAGADIFELNCVRKHLSSLKGGQLARVLYPSTVLSLIVSDVVCDRLDMVASGPTVPDPTTFLDAMKVIQKYKLTDSLPVSVRRRLRAGIEGLIEETPKQADKVFRNVHNVLIGNNSIAVDAAKRFLSERGFVCSVVERKMTGEAREKGKWFGRLLAESRAGKALIVGGETTVKVKNQMGKGGRSMEFALAAAAEIADRAIAIVCFGTDGVDGNTDAAGGYVDGKSLKRGEEIDVSASKCLELNDSYTFFKALGDLIITGRTGTNVNDVAVGIVMK